MFTIHPSAPACRPFQTASVTVAAVAGKPAMTTGGHHAACCSAFCQLNNQLVMKIHANNPCHQSKSRWPGITSSIEVQNWLYIYIYTYVYIYPHVYTYVYIYIHIPSYTCWQLWGSTSSNPPSRPPAPVALLAPPRASPGEHRSPARLWSTWSWNSSSWPKEIWLRYRQDEDLGGL